jgi:hypothetical protein
MIGAGSLSLGHGHPSPRWSGFVSRLRALRLIRF